jgi:cell division protein FtsB
VRLYARAFGKPTPRGMRQMPWRISEQPNRIRHMYHFQNQTADAIIYITAGVVILIFGYQIGRWIGSLSAMTKIKAKEQDLFTAQKGFKQLYETELASLKAKHDALEEENKSLVVRVEEYRKKAAGFGGLFNSGGKKADAMYALLLENEALEEALHSQNEKLKQERTDSVKEQLRAAGYRRVLMSQLMNDERIKGYIQEILADEKHLPGVAENQSAPALPG